MFEVYTKQECIPVGCVPAARRPYAGVCFPGGGGGGGGCLPGLGGVGLPGQGGSAWSWGGLASQHALRQTPSPRGQTDTCKNITLATTSLRPVKIVL